MLAAQTRPDFLQFVATFVVDPLVFNRERGLMEKMIPLESKNLLTLMAPLGNVTPHTEFKDSKHEDQIPSLGDGRGLHGLLDRFRCG